MRLVLTQMQGQEYVALAGTCKFFRHHRDEPFFKALRVKQISVFPYGAPGVTDHDRHAAKRPFSRDVPDWRVPRPLKTTHTPALRYSRPSKEVQPKPKPTHYIPRGERSTWTRSQYTVYKEEKSHYREAQWKKRKSELKVIAKDLLEAEKRSQAFIDLGYQNRWVLGRVSGRADGQPPIEKDEKGLPVTVKLDTSEQDDEGHHSERITELNDGETTESEKRKRETDDDQGRTPEPSRTPSRKRAKGKRGEIWTVPEESEDESEYDELAYMAKHGYTAIHDFWPSASRLGASKFVSQDRLSKTVSTSSHSPPPVTAYNPGRDAKVQGDRSRALNFVACASSESQDVCYHTVLTRAKAQSNGWEKVSTSCHVQYRALLMLCSQSDSAVGHMPQ